MFMCELFISYALLYALWISFIIKQNNLKKKSLIYVSPVTCGIYWLWESFIYMLLMPLSQGRPKCTCLSLHSKCAFPEWCVIIWAYLIRFIPPKLKSRKASLSTRNQIVHGEPLIKPKTFLNMSVLIFLIHIFFGAFEFAIW